ncbi:DNA-processing protein DprA [Gordonia sputi]|uniref:Putative DNA processing protein n=1 Tax=Gordonia sputi NBRC 100414 TaxID=1089453 RepID=H5TX68_9ACTN|nr:DNA-processing protein DprA [Gordonia sputi]NKY94934.1 hypothetical protein [Gordonia sputi]GAB38076.1 putative DNA processing protein [Gordonia sputi NBRC 100414]
MPSELEDIERVLFAIHIARTPAKIRDVLLDRNALHTQIGNVDSDTAARIRDEAAEFATSVGVISADNSRFPVQLVRRGKAIVPALFYRGELGLLDTPMVAVSGSRKVSDRGAAAATRLGEIVAQSGQTLVSGNARGVDTLATTAASSRGGSTVLVLPEGITHFRPDEENPDIGMSDSTGLVLSQFSPHQPWSVHTAMGRNRVICGLAGTVVVVEAGESGGSLAAGREALKLGRHLVTLTYGDHTPEGNQILISEGASPIASPDALREALLPPSDDEPEQARLL